MDRVQYICTDFPETLLDCTCIPGVPYGLSFVPDRSCLFGQWIYVCPSDGGLVLCTVPCLWLQSHIQRVLIRSPCELLRTFLCQPITVPPIGAIGPAMDLEILKGSTGEPAVFCFFLRQESNCVLELQLSLIVSKAVLRKAPSWCLLACSAPTS